jgi:hypothetical protein
MGVKDGRGRPCRGEQPTVRRTWVPRWSPVLARPARIVYRTLELRAVLVACAQWETNRGTRKKDKGCARPDYWYCRSVVVIGAGHPVFGFNSELDECIKEVLGSGQVSRRVAAVVGIAFYGAKIEGQDATGPKITSGGEVYVARNLRFTGPNPVETERRPHGVSRGNMATEKMKFNRGNFRNQSSLPLPPPLSSGGGDG